MPLAAQIAARPEPPALLTCDSDGCSGTQVVCLATGEGSALSVSGGA